MLERIVFPLGNLTKKKVYEISKKEGIGFFKPAEQSNDACFFDSMEQDEYLRKNFSENPGEIVDESGAIIGSHKGLFFYTIGQRKGIALAGGPYFVLAKDKNLNRLVVTKDEKKIFTKSLMVKKYNLLTADEIENGMVVEVKIRSTQKSFGAKIFKIEDGLEIRFDEPQRAVTSGQVAAFYNDDILLGGGEIE